MIYGASQTIDPALVNLIVIGPIRERTLRDTRSSRTRSDLLVRFIIKK